MFVEIKSSSSLWEFSCIKQQAFILFLTSLFSLLLIWIYFSWMLMLQLVLVNFSTLFVSLAVLLLNDFLWISMSIVSSWSWELRRSIKSSESTFNSNCDTKAMKWLVVWAIDCYRLYDIYKEKWTKFFPNSSHCFLWKFCPRVNILVLSILLVSRMLKPFILHQYIQSGEGSSSMKCLKYFISLWSIGCIMDKW